MRRDPRAVEVVQHLISEGHTELLGLLMREDFMRDLEHDLKLDLESRRVQSRKEKRKARKYKRKQKQQAILHEAEEVLFPLGFKRMVGTLVEGHVLEVVEQLVKNNKHDILETLATDGFTEYLKRSSHSEDTYRRLERERETLVSEWERQKQIQELEQLEYFQDQAGLWDTDE